MAPTNTLSTSQIHIYMLIIQVLTNAFQILVKQKELDDLKRQIEVFKAKMESLLISQLEILKDVNPNE